MTVPDDKPRRLARGKVRMTSVEGISTEVEALLKEGMHLHLPARSGEPPLTKKQGARIIELLEGIAEQLQRNAMGR